MDAYEVGPQNPDSTGQKLIHESGRANSSLSQKPKLDLPVQVERVYADAQPNPDPEIVERFCQAWAEVGRAILARRGRVAA